MGDVVVSQYATGLDRDAIGTTSDSFSQKYDLQDCRNTALGDP